MAAPASGDTEAAAHAFTADHRRRRRRLTIAAISLGIVLVAAYVVLFHLPPRLADSAERAGADCRTSIYNSGLGDPDACRKAPALGGVLAADRARAAKVTWENDYRTTWLAVDLAAFRDLDGARRDALLRRLLVLARSHTASFVMPELAATSVGARAVVVEAARAPRGPEVEVGITPLWSAGIDAALVLGDLDAVAAIAATIPDSQAIVRRSLLCLVGKGECAPVDRAGEHEGAVAAALEVVERGGSDEQVLAPLVGDGAGWSGQFDEVHPGAPYRVSPELAERLAAALVARAWPATVPAAGRRKPGPPVAPPAAQATLVRVAWVLHIDAAYARSVLGDVAGAREAFARADALAARSDLPAPLPVESMARLRRLADPEGAAAWLDARLAVTPDHRELLVERMLARLDRGDLDGARAALPPRPAGDCDGACEALEWVRLALAVSAGDRAGLEALASGPSPTPDGESGEESWWCGRLEDGEARALIVHAINGGAAERAKVRWWCQSTWADDPRSGLDLAVRLVALGALAADGDVEVYLDTQLSGQGARALQLARERAATWRGDAAAAKVWRERRERVEAALRAHPELYPRAEALGL